MITDLFTAGLEIIKRVIPDKEKQKEAQLKLLDIQQNGELKLIEQQASVIIAEAKSESWLARNWRPVTMLTFVSIIANNYIIAPYLHAFGATNVILDIPPKMWGLMELGLGGYVVGRTVEKAIEKWKKN